MTNSLFPLTHGVGVLLVQDGGREEANAASGPTLVPFLAARNSGGRGEGVCGVDPGSGAVVGARHGGVPGEGRWAVAGSVRALTGASSQPQQVSSACGSSAGAFISAPQRRHGARSSGFPGPHTRAAQRPTAAAHGLVPAPQRPAPRPPPPPPHSLSRAPPPSLAGAGEECVTVAKGAHCRQVRVERPHLGRGAG